MKTPQPVSVPGMSAKIAAPLAAAALLLLAGAAPAGAAEPEFVPGQLLVRFDPGVGKAEGGELAADQGGDVVERFAIVPRLALVDLPPGLGVEAAERRFERLGEVAFAQPNLVYETALTPNDEFFTSAPNALWGLNNTGQPVPNSSSLNPPLVSPPFPTDTGGITDADIDAPEAWDIETGDAAVTVGVIDSGLTVAHEDIAPNLWTNPAEIAGNATDDDGNGLVDDVNGWDFVEGDNTPDDASGHGTHVAGAVGAQGDNMVGTTGASWNVSLMGLKAGSADGRLYSTTIMAAIGYADAHRVPIVNGSYGGGGSDDPPDAERIAYGNAGETLFVVAAGNAGVDLDAAGNSAFPCEYTLPNILCVGATTPSDGLASFSNFGRQSVDVGAPGTNALSTDPAFAAPVFFDNFETPGLAKWVVEGTPAASWFNSPDPEGPNLGTSGLSDSPGGNYVNNENSSIRMADPIDLRGMDSCRLNTALGFTLGTGDELRVEYTTDSILGLPNWRPLSFPYSGNGAFAFRNLDMDLAGATGNANVRIRFRLVTDGSATADGVHIDNVKVECVDTALPGSLGVYRVRQGTSMASPQVAGVAALVLAADPGQDLTVAELRNTLLASVDPLSALCTTTTTGGRINAATALAISPVAGAPPPSSCTASVNPPPITVAPPATPPAEPAAVPCAGQNATIIGTEGADTLSGTPAADVIAGLGGNDKISGLSGKDTICGGSGNDKLKGGGGNDMLLGQKGKDTLEGGPGAKDKLKGGPGKDKQIQ